MVPTPLGGAVIDCFDAVCPRLAQPTFRASMERQFTLIASGVAEKEAVLDENLARFLNAFSGFAADIAKVRPFFVSDEAIDGIIEATRAAALVRAAAVAERRLTRLTDGELRRQDQEASIISDVIADAERRRLLTDRAAIESAARESMSEADQIRSLFSYGAPEAGGCRRGGAAAYGDGHSGGQHGGGARGAGGCGGLLHYQAELERLRALALTDAPDADASHPSAASARTQPQQQGHNRSQRSAGQPVGRGGRRGGRGGGGPSKAGALPVAENDRDGASTKRRDRESRKGSFL